MTYSNHLLPQPAGGWVGGNRKEIKSEVKNADRVKTEGQAGRPK